MSRVLLISPAPITGGAEAYALTVALAVSHRGWSAHMALPVTPGTEAIRAQLGTAGIPVIDLPCVDNYKTGAPPTWRRQIQSAGSVVRLLQRIAPDVVHLTIPWPRYALSSLLAAAFVGLPTVVVFQLVPDPVPLATAPRLYRFMRGRSQAWVTVSAHGRRLLAAAVGLPADRLELIYNGASVPLSGTLDVNNVRRSVRAELGLEPDARLVLCVGRLHEQKGHRDLITAWSDVIGEHSDSHLIIIGEGDEEQTLRIQATDMGIADRVHLLGQRSDVPRLLCAGDVFAFASRVEGSPFALVEAMASGLPIVSTQFPGADEIIRNGQDGVLVPVGDVAALGANLATMLGDSERRERLGAAARSRARAFSEEHMIDQTLDLLAAQATHSRRTFPRRRSVGRQRAKF